MNSVITIVMCTAIIGAVYTRAYTHPRAEDTLDVTPTLEQLERELAEASAASDFQKVARISKQCIALGYRTAEMYASVAVALAFASDTVEGRRYLDTALALGWNIRSSGGLIAMMYGIELPPAAISIDSLLDAHAQSVPNASLDELVHQDQYEREVLVTQVGVSSVASGFSLGTAWKMVRNDSLRRSRLHLLLRDSALTTPKQLQQAALIFLHSRDTNDHFLSYQLALQAIQMDDMT